MLQNNDVQKDIQDRINLAISNIKEQYLAKDNDLPWLIGYSGGKDSTCTAQLVFRALMELKQEKKKLNRKVTIFSSDTMIENPLVKDIIEKNIKLINLKANELKLPVDALILKPEVDRTFWVNVIGRGYPTPNTMFRWCTDRLKIEPANNFIKKYIDANGEVIMVLGVREGESNTRDRVLKNHEIEGYRLMKHTTLTNAYVFPAIKHLTTVDVFTYLAAYESPWNSNNKELYFFYEESGGGDCPIFLSEKDKNSQNACGNSRMGCWVCTVVSQDKSLSGFISTGFYDYLIPLRDFRDWIVSIRDEYSYRCHHRNNGSIYKKVIKIVERNGQKYLTIPSKGSKGKIDIKIGDNDDLVDNNGNKYSVIYDDEFELFLKKNRLNYNSKELETIIIKDHITMEYCKLGSGPFTDKAKLEILQKLLEAEAEFNCYNKTRFNIISDAEIIEIKKIWRESGLSVSSIDELMIQNGRKIVGNRKDSFGITEKYDSILKKYVKKYDLDYKTTKQLINLEKNNITKEDRKDIQSEIENIFISDKMNV